MRPLVAAAATTVLPALAGMRWLAGSWLLRWSLGAMLGIVALAVGGIAAGLLALPGAPASGAAVALAAVTLLGPRIRWQLPEVHLDPVARRVLIVLAVVGVALLAMATLRPVASWDGWFMWSLKSKALAVAGTFTAPVFLDPAYGYASQDVPTLLPAWQAVAYQLGGDLAVSWPLQVQQAWLWLAGAGALVGFLAGGRPWLFLLPVAWLASPQVVWEAMQSYADVPMALLLLAGALVLWRAGSDPRAHALGGVLLGGAMLTKNEGLPMALAVLVFVLASRRFRPGWVVAVAPAVALGLRAVWAVFTTIHGLSTHMILPRSFTWEILSQVPGRIPLILGTMGGEALSPMRWGLLVPACIASIAVYRRFSGRLLLAFTGSIAALVAVYALWPYRSWELADYMTVNVDRVLIAPLGLLALAVALRRPSEGPAGDEEEAVRPAAAEPR